MPYTLQIGDIIELNAYQQLYGQTIITSLHYTVVIQGTTGNGYTDLAGIAASSVGSLGVFQKLSACQGPEVTYPQVSAQKVYPTRFARVPITTGLSGANIGQAMQQNVAAVVTKRTEASTVRHLKQKLGQVGSVHIAGMPATSFDSGYVTMAARTGVLGDFCNAVMAIITFGTLGQIAPVLWHRGNQTTPFNYLLNCFPEATTRVMRRRTVGLGI